MNYTLFQNNEAPKKRKFNILILACFENIVGNVSRVFNEIWTEKYFFIQEKTKALCLICREYIPVFKIYNLKRHYTQKHAITYDTYVGKCRADKLSELKKDLASQQTLLKKAVNNPVNVVKASYVVANLIAKKSKSFIDGEFIKECMVSVADLICEDKKSEFSKISLSHQTIATRIQDLATSIEETLKRKCFDCKFYSLALDDSTDASDTAQLAIFIRGIDKQYNIFEELLALVPLKNTTRSVDMYDALKLTMERFSLSFHNLSAIVTDGAPAMVGKNGGLVTMARNEATVCGNQMLMTYHCIIHQEHLCGKVLKMENVTQVVIQTINYIRSKGLQHRQFQEFLKVMGSDFEDVTYYTEVRWLSRGNMFQRFYHLRTEIVTFMETKGKSVSELADDNWNCDLAFLVDVTAHLNDLNLRLQGTNQFVSTMFQIIKAFETKLKLWYDQLKVKNLIYFETLATALMGAKISAASCEKYAALLFDLIQDFERRFTDFRQNELNFNIFVNPFCLDIGNLPTYLQMECIELQADIEIKAKFCNTPLLDFYQICLPPDKYPCLHNHALFMSSAFSSTYICEQLFSRLKHTKNPYRTTITDKHLENSLRIATSTIEPDIDSLVREKQIHPSH